MRERNPCVYIMASGRHGTIYIGATSDLMARVYQHREGLIDGSTKRYGVKRLVFYEMHETMDAAIVREKRLKAWKRDWKIALIETDNPFWEDLAIHLGFPPPT
ncbi:MULTISPECIES: GIY-YIG nuclease family protein [Sphingopyxis]|uniref:Excinuclease ABC subunit C n=1 Tax=Sphingopyxis granuli TaxID=267128 RepID=A0AA86L4N4_9SPHN|nr:MULTISPECIES: GIY-YIG nuclease family protein [Sphingopyxis]AMG76404.1 Excinuclease ABC subunit C [Sphingopyxis granuli]APW73957.1 endonuclease [Sphingopyxis granuli]AVA15286.1 endonuclease [Sphingopyxis sp. MG]